ncbi:kinase [Halobacillus massiliensis]|uniref:kinase n=1 Tax=Halobacillus massiliensis TaxID=1926286 RepID=UPI0009E3BF65|nr:kinase [Halobacillus massiliensis]
MDLKDIMNKLPKVEDGQRVVLGIDGLSRSGKTTFARKIEQYFKGKTSVCIFHIDNYIVERKRRYNTNYEEWYEYYHLQWDVEWLEENFFKKLKGLKELHLLTYHYHSDTCKVELVNIPDTCLIIIEGVFLQRKEWRNYFDFIVFLDCEREKRFNRESMETRKNVEKFKKRYWRAEDYYMKSIFPKEQADLIILN